ncbi:hypothetical protein Hanom_Chr10g00964921 [Helianthus anomalus]
MWGKKVGWVNKNIIFDGHNNTKDMCFRWIFLSKNFSIASKATGYGGGPPLEDDPPCKCHVGWGKEDGGKEMGR